jgi:ABC-2 type transport system ATP-binding protein
VNSTTPAPVIEVRELSKVYLPTPAWARVFMRSQVTAPVRALDDVSLTVNRGAISVIAGANGAGKSTLFRILTGLLEPSSGLVRVGGSDPVTNSVEVRRMLGYVPGDDRSLYLRHSCRENLLFRTRLHGFGPAERRARTDEVLELVDLGHAADRAGFALSAGMRARLQLAGALLHRPPVLVLDEPTGAIDPVGSYELLEMVRRLTREVGLTVLLSTHRVDEIEAFGEDIVLLHQGRIRYHGDLAGLRSDSTRRIRLVFANMEAAESAAERLNGWKGAAPPKVTGTALVVSDAPSLGAVLSALRGSVSEVVSLEEVRAPLRQTLADLLRDEAQ